jgi:hypothetical protein
MRHAPAKLLRRRPDRGRPRKCALPCTAPPTVPGVPAHLARPARRWPIV